MAGVRTLGPLMVAAGCGGTGRELAAHVGPDVLEGLTLVTRTLTLQPHPGAALGSGPRVVETPGGLLHAVGRDNPGVDAWTAEELPWLVRAGVRPVASISGASVGEHVEAVRRLARAPGLAGVEVDLSAPDAPHGPHSAAGSLEVREPVHAAHLVASVRRELPVDLPLLAKLRPEPLRVAETARSVLDAGASAVVVGNALAASMPDGRAAGLSGPALLPLVRRCVAEVLAAVPGAPVVACGGVADVAGARSLLDLGALAVQVGTALLHDPTVLARLHAGLRHPTDPTQENP